MTACMHACSYQPAKPEVHMATAKIPLDHVQSKVGSLDNINHKPESMVHLTPIMPLFELIHTGPSLDVFVSAFLV